MIHAGQDTRATQLFNDIIATFWGHAPNKKRRCTMLLNLLLDELGVIAQESQSAEAEWSVSVIDLFRRYPSRTFSLEEIAEMIGMNVRTLSTRFRQITGQSVHQYQMNYKLEVAYQQLRTGITVKEVANNLGFCDAYYFSRQFKKKFGVTPKEIKERDPRANINRKPLV